MSKSSKSQKSSIINDISKQAAKRGVSIILDGDNTSLCAMEGKQYLYDEDTKTLTIVLDKLAPDELDEVGRIAIEYFEKFELILDAEQEAILEGYQGYDSFNPYKEILNLFQGKIPTQDLNALKMSLYMRVQSENGLNVDQIKKQIKDRFGSRGAYIANLCKAGYFEDIFRNQCLKLAGDKFSSYYELKVGQELAALFVHIGLTATSLASAFVNKVQSCMQNDIGKFRILGFGRKNYDLIEDLRKISDDLDMETKVQWELRLDCPAPHVGIEYDIIVP